MEIELVKALRMLMIHCDTVLRFPNSVWPIDNLEDYCKELNEKFFKADPVGIERRYSSDQD